MGRWVKAGMPKGRVTQADERAASTDAAALVATAIIANNGAWICGKALLLESGEQRGGESTIGQISISAGLIAIREDSAAGARLTIVCRVACEVWF